MSSTLYTSTLYVKYTQLTQQQQRVVILGGVLVVLGSLVGSYSLWRRLWGGNRWDARQLDFSSANSMTYTLLKELWANYDLNGSTRLEPTEVRALIITYFRSMSTDKKLRGLYVEHLFSSLPKYKLKAYTRERIVRRLGALFHQLHVDSQRIYEDISDRLDKAQTKGVKVREVELVPLFSMYVEKQVALCLQDINL